MVLLEDVVQVFELPHDDWRFASAIDLLHGRLVGPALVHRDLFGNTTTPNSPGTQTLYLCGFAQWTGYCL